MIPLDPLDPWGSLRGGAARQITQKPSLAVPGRAWGRGNVGAWVATPGAALGPREPGGLGPGGEALLESGGLGGEAPGENPGNQGKSRKSMKIGMVFI